LANLRVEVCCPYRLGIWPESPFSQHSYIRVRYLQCIRGHCSSLPWPLAENWETGLQSLVLAKSMIPRFALINHFYEMILSVRIDCCAETWLEWYQNSLIYIYQKKSGFHNNTQLSVKRTVVKSFTWFSVRLISP